MHRLSKIFASALALDDVLINFAGGDVVFASERDVEIAFTWVVSAGFWD